MRPVRACVQKASITAFAPNQSPPVVQKCHRMSQSDRCRAPFIRFLPPIEVRSHRKAMQSSVEFFEVTLRNDGEAAALKDSLSGLISIQVYDGRGFPRGHPSSNDQNLIEFQWREGDKGKIQIGHAEDRRGPRAQSSSPHEEHLFLSGRHWRTCGTGGSSNFLCREGSSGDHGDRSSYSAAVSNATADRDQAPRPTCVAISTAALRIERQWFSWEFFPRCIPRVCVNSINSEVVRSRPDVMNARHTPR